MTSAAVPCARIASATPRSHITAVTSSALIVGRSDMCPFESGLEDQLKAIKYDENVGKIPVVEIFRSLQGEGILIGTPSIFVRTAVCNLHCIWCDTKYTWVPKLLEREVIRWLTPQEIADAVVDMTGNTVRNVVFTGGEPMLWWDRGLREAIRLLGSKGFFVEVETNGTIAPEGAENMWFLRFNVSFKLSNNRADSHETRIRPDVLRYFNKHIAQGISPFFERVTWKIVITSREDLDELLKIMDEVGLDKRFLVIMPEMTYVEKLKSYDWLVEWCIENGVRFIDRLHIRLWGTARGR